MTTLTDSLASLERLAAATRDAADGVDQAAKSCCAAIYGFDLVELLLGTSYHPGGAGLTRRLAELVALRRGERVLDAAAGIGTSALLLAGEYGAEVLGVDLGERQVGRARERSELSGLSDLVRFAVGDAEHLPVEDSSIDVVVCECAFCTFPAKDQAARELVRVLRPGGRVAMADVWLDPGTLDPELSGLAGRIACLADARPVEGTGALLAEAGCTVTDVVRCDEALLESILQVHTRLRALRFVDVALPPRFDLRRAIDLARRAADVVRRGDAGYVLIGARAP